MAGIERLEVHSKSYVVRWINIDQGNTLSWSIQPQKKSINFGIVKHPGTGSLPLVASLGDDGDAAQPQGLTDGKSNRSSKKEATAQDMLAGRGFVPITWYGKCEADKVSLGTHDVHPGHGGMYGLVFDNTFSKQTSKMVTFVVLTFPTGVPPRTASHMPNLQLPQAQASQTSLGRIGSPRSDVGPSASVDSFNSQNPRARANSTSGNQTYHVGTLSKRRRKKGQGYARRFFSLDYSTCTLSYYHNRGSSALRGAIPLSLAAIAADERRREISIDSGAEIWHLRAHTDKEFQEWARALEKASRIAREGSDTTQPVGDPNLTQDRGAAKLANEPRRTDDVEWQQVEALVSRVVGTRDALRRLTTEVAALPRPSAAGQFLSPSSTVGEEGYFPSPVEKRPFWRRKSSAAAVSPTANLQASSSPDSTPHPGTQGAEPPSGKRSKAAAQAEKSIHDHCQALLSDLDSVVSEFSTLITNNKRRRPTLPQPNTSTSRMSIETTSTDEFFDAEDAKSAVVKIDGSGDESAETEAEEVETRDGSSISSMDDDEPAGTGSACDLCPGRPKNLYPLPIEGPVSRRTTIPPATIQPPSLIAFVRKNVGKDLSTISMPVSANEPTSLLQKLAEQLEYAQLLDKASRQKSPTERLLFVTAFAISQFSSGRQKERAMRKPFNPLLGETFELVRTNKEIPGGFRLLVEKVQHRPVRLAIHAESANWSFAQSPAPGQKFWGKSAEVTTEGRVRVALRLTDGSDEYYSWNIATMFLRNVVMGEKYVEPVGTMSVLNDSTGHKAVVEFKSKGMFGGRSEDVQVTTFAPNGSDTGSGLVGTWTGGLRTVGPGKSASEEVWQTGELVEKAAQTYGMTLFAASLNELTAIEKGKLARTDSRLRPDQRLAEQGDLDEAEVRKQQLEEAQRERRRVMEERGEMYKPRWFVKVEGGTEGEEVWRMKTGKDGYWEERARGTWTGVPAIFEV
ncbi:hypothetical protein HIM_04379 [Hirsutella minnesotensis 3608]|uniref:PH domain-containing protein n=1 Tax=Hirsutella minnesotensis 3608 TaxID=1043627 RepID=A0A0F8A1K9_9HYPO|nr:hypothetical protein HIM_04379 [Hirsutella minnesotensis 3608]